MAISYRSVPTEQRLQAMRAAALVAVTLLGLFAGRAHGQQAGQAPAGDPTVVIARTVHPRIAYRALPAQENPIRTEATTFPGQVFHGTLDQSLAPLIGDAELGQHGSTGLSPAAATGALTGMLVPTDSFGASGNNGLLGPSAATPVGPTASVGGAVTHATSGIADLVTGSVMQALAPQGNGR
ncbi:hypothetical protein [Lysobacter sp. Hz 25]|uniref:hypothetical protein n=1 Tax=Lysobacter sp. Hz 25 TaxID=3383698 RepID=UPI0038D4E583